MKKLTVQFVIHLAAWACFLTLPFVFYPRREESFSVEKMLNAFFIVNNLFVIGFYYVNTYLLIPKLIDHKKFLSYTVIVLSLLVFYGFLPRIWHNLVGPFAPNFQPKNFQPRQPGQPHKGPLVNAGNIAIFLMVFVFSTGIKIINEWLRSEARNKEIANEKLQAELSFLKAQINPHFLFNTLNNIYALASVQSEHTAPAVMKLSSIMRYVLTEARNDLVPLEKEIQFTTHYIELQKMRLTDKTSIDFTVNGDPFGRQIAPLLLLPFVENAFKYGISTREASPIRILLDIQKDSLYFSISNLKHVNTSLKGTDNTGIGITNTKRRLDLFYQDRYQLNIEDNPNGFSVHLKIPV